MTFATSTGLTGTWPEPPTYWSYSSLTEVESCPRRYALKHAMYPELWDRSGYPDRVGAPSIVGAAIHQGVEAVVRAPKVSGCTSIADERAVEVLRRLGGFTSVTLTAAESVLIELEDNPRMQPQLARLRDRVQRLAPEMRRAIQTLVSRMPMASEDPLALSVGDTPGAPRSRIGAGTHPEVHLLAEDIQFIGRIDLLTVRAEHVEIVDFKTGHATDHHREQVTLYGLLWMLDDIANPDHLPVGALTVAYVGREEPVPIPEDWNSIRSELQNRIEAAEHALIASPPHATPSLECRHCPVRQMCEEYWESKYVSRDPSSRFGDVEVTVLEQRGSKSWSVRLADGSAHALLRSTTEAEPFNVGQRLRILDAMFDNEDNGWTVVTINTTSEVFRADLA